MELTQNPSYTETTSLLKSRTWFDWLFLAVLAAGALFALNRYGDLSMKKVSCSLQCRPLFGLVGIGGQCAY